ncbi:hypothetical protein ACHAXA_006836 [Cyclostephanos tholiformis]|uniref:Procollagen-proline 4-dioxygenase n=1 Tax=Cyclostephanos tholiformis TaxID=382380 RepID=A0ABD3RJW0_9STRA
MMVAYPLLLLLLLLLLLDFCGGETEASSNLVEDDICTKDGIGDAGSGGGGTSCSGSESVISTSSPLLTSEFKFAHEGYKVGRIIDAYFDGLQNDEDSCDDESDECEDEAERGLCMTDPARMKELGCDRSCLYCLTKSSRDLLSLGVDQITGHDDDEEICLDENIKECEEDARRGYCTIDPDRMEENGCFKSCLYCRTSTTDKDLFLRGVDQTIKAANHSRPSSAEVLEVMAKSERYFVNEVLVNEDLEIYRLECRNKNALCAFWAAQGYCESTPGEMGENCAAACRNCPLVNYDVRCPIDVSTNIFKPGDMNAMFERLLEASGQDLASFSRDNLPIGGSVLGIGEVTVITSPYHDPSRYPRDDDEEDDDISPLPWVLSIDGFLNDEECNRLIELGEAKGYRRSRVGSTVFKESSGRTSYNTFCDKVCATDPIVQRVLKRIVSLTGIPYDNYEGLQLVRYEPGQFYEQHHDESGVKKYSGPRILTVFLYLNDVLGGGGTEFHYLNFTATPKRGSALIWPSMLDSLEGKDEWTWHEALPVEEGYKYGANAWIRLRDFQNAKCRQTI